MKYFPVFSSFVVLLFLSGCVSKPADSEPKVHFVCHEPYMRVGNSCCLDINYNRICDDDEKVVYARTTTSAFHQTTTLHASQQTTTLPASKAASSLAVTSSTLKPASSAYMKYSNSEYGFSMDYPPGWRVVENYMNITVWFFAPRQGLTDLTNENVNVIVVPYEREMSASELESDFDKFTANYPKFKKLHFGEESGFRYRTVRFVFEYDYEGTKLRVLSYLVITGGRVYWISLTALPETYSMYLPVIERQVRSFRAGT